MRMLNFCPQKVEKPILKSCSEFRKFTFFTALTAQTKEFLLQNVAYLPTLYRTGVFCVKKNCAQTPCM